LKVIHAAGLALVVTVAGLATTSPVRAQDIELRIGPDGVRPVIRDPRQPEYRGDDRRRPPPPPSRGCSEREARAAAREAGLRDPEVVRVTPGRVVVEGYTRRGPQRITFANERGCPEL
jgi:hypothetical protein